MPPSYRSLFRLAKKSLEGNIVHLKSGRYLAAGRGQFHGLWTRDFCFASRGLLRLGYGDVVRDHISLLLKSRRPRDHLVPRLVDSISPAWLRVLHFSCRKALPIPLGKIPLRDPLRPEYRSEHGVESIDSNLLVLLTALFYVNATGDLSWWTEHEPSLVKVYQYYEDRIQDGLAVQNVYSDWQDSVKRKGRTFYTNLLYYVTSARLLSHVAFGITSQKLQILREKIDQAFFDSDLGVFRSLEGSQHVSLDGNLLALDLEYYSRESSSAKLLYQSLKRHPLWRGGNPGPGFNTYPNYPDQWTALQVKVVGLKRYHDELYWSWLMALSAKMAHRFGDEEQADGILSRLQEMVKRDQAVMEVYSPEPTFQAFRTQLYSSEAHFSWGAGFIVDTLREIVPAVV